MRSARAVSALVSSGTSTVARAATATQRTAATTSCFMLTEYHAALATARLRRDVGRDQQAGGRGARALSGLRHARAARARARRVRRSCSRSTTGSPELRRIHWRLLSDVALLRALAWWAGRWSRANWVGDRVGRRARRGRLYGPYRLSTRGMYAEHVWILVANGAAYPCFCDRGAPGGAARAAARREEAPGLRPSLPRLAPDEAQAASRRASSTSSAWRCPSTPRPSSTTACAASLTFENRRSTIRYC